MRKEGEIVDVMQYYDPVDPGIDEVHALYPGTAIFLADVPVTGLQNQVRVNPFNTTYWTNWPTAENNYVNPQSWWNTTALIIHNIEPAQ